MLKGQNYNHAKLGAQIWVEPIKLLTDIELIKELLTNNPRNLLLFILGINTNLNTKELLSIKAWQVRHLNPGESIQIVNTRNGKIRKVPLNKLCIRSIENLFKNKYYNDNDSIFMGYRGLLTISSVTRMVKSWCNKINLTGNYGSQSLRKTWGYHQYVTYNVDIRTIMKYLHFANIRQTRNYLGIEPKPVRSLFENEI
ncbi:MAG: integrase [Geobacteraceae bacterium]|nr:MAG: integrase [Geobacteraceae bacterium]